MILSLYNSSNNQCVKIRLLYSRILLDHKSSSINWRRDLLCPTKRSEVGTGQPYNQSLTICFVGDFLLVARFLPGFFGFLILSVQKYVMPVAINTILIIL